MAFGAGADSLLIEGGAQATGFISDADGRLTIDIRNGGLTLRETAPVSLTSLSVGPSGVLNVMVDPQTGAATRLDASGSVVLEAGAKVSVSVKSLLTEPKSFEIVRAGALRVDAGVATALTGAPFLYSATLRADTAAGRLYADLRRRTAAELGLNVSGAQAYEAVSAAIGRNDAVKGAFLSKLDQAGFTAVYDQMLPDHSGAALASATAISRSISFASGQRPPAGAEPGQSTFWAQEIYFDIDQDGRDARDYHARALGFAAGVEQTTQGRGAYGLALGLVSNQFEDKGAAVGERVVMNFAGGSLYARQEFGGWVADVRAGGGLVAFDSDRRIVSSTDSLSLTARSDWVGWLGELHAGIAYRLNLGRLFLRPRADLDYLRLHENGHSEEGGGAGVDLELESRSGSALTGTAMITVGMELGDGFRWGPEFTYGRRERFSGKVGTTVGRFVGGGPDFALASEPLESGSTIMRAGLRGSAMGAVVTIDGGLEFAGAYRQWDLRAVAKFAF